MPAPIYQLLYMAAHKNISRGSTVTGITADDTYENDWLCDDRSSRPLRVAALATTTVTFPAAGDANFCALLNSQLDPGATVTITIGGETCVITIPSRGPDGVTGNLWGWLSAPVVGASSAVVTYAGHTGAAWLGELVIGTLDELGQYIFRPGRRTVKMKSVSHDQEFDAFPDYNLNAKTRGFQGSTRLNDENQRLVEDLFVSQEGFSKPVGFVTDYLDNRFLWGRLTDFSTEKHHPQDYGLTINVETYAEVKWP